MKQFITSLITIIAVWGCFGFLGGKYVVAPVFADTPVIYSNILLSQDPHRAHSDGVFFGSCTANENLSVYVGESEWLNEWNDFEIWYEVADVSCTNGKQWIHWPIDTQTYYYTDLHWDRMGHSDTLTTVLTDCDWAGGGDWIVYCIDYKAF